jgi:GNAT superfamily N-acetyltransferase
MSAIARAIPRSLLAPIVKFVPEGRIEPSADGHMLFPGTISLEEATFEALLTDIARSYRAHGFKDLILIGDSGGNQPGMRAVAAALNQRWAGEGSNARVHFLPEYYEEDMWSYAFLKQLGITQVDETLGQPRDQPTHTRNGIHDDVYYEAQVAVQDPSLIRWAQRERAGLLTLHGIDLRPQARLVDIGRRLLAALLDHGASLGCVQGWVLTSPANTAARALYAGAGGREAPEQSTMFEFSLDPGSG